MQILKLLFFISLLSLILYANENYKTDFPNNKVKEEKIPLSINKKFNNELLYEYPNTIYITTSTKAKRLKNEFLNGSSQYYSIAIATLPLTENSLKNFYKKYGIENESLAHLYGKNRDKIRVLYGLFATPKEAKEALDNLNKNLKLNRPFFMKLSNFQGFYQKSLSKQNRVKLKVDDKKEDKRVVSPNLSTNLKILTPSKKRIKEEPKDIKSIKKKTEEKKEKKVLKKKSNSILKKSKYKDVFYLEKKGDVNLLNEVFLDDKSSFYTVVLGDITLSKMGIEEYYIKYDLNNNSLAYKYGKNKEKAKIIFGAYESKSDVLNASKELDNYLDNKTKVSEIEEQRLLYKKFHQKIGENLSIELLYLHKDAPYNIKDEFLKSKSTKYTIQLATIKKSRRDLDRFIINNSIGNNLLIYELHRGYYKIFYGVFDSLKEAKDKIESLNSVLKENRPFVSKIDTIRNRFEYYNNLSKGDYFKNIETIKLD